MRKKIRNHSSQKYISAKPILYLLSIVIFLISVNGNPVLANQITADKMQFVKPQDRSDNGNQIQAPLFNIYLPLI